MLSSTISFGITYRALSSKTLEPYHSEEPINDLLYFITISTTAFESFLSTELISANLGFSFIYLRIVSFRSSSSWELPIHHLHYHKIQRFPEPFFLQQELLSYLWSPSPSFSQESTTNLNPFLIIIFDIFIPYFKIVYYIWYMLLSCLSNNIIPSVIDIIFIKEIF